MHANTERKNINEGKSKRQPEKEEKQQINLLSNTVMMLSSKMATSNLQMLHKTNKELLVSQLILSLNYLLNNQI